MSAGTGLVERLSLHAESFPPSLRAKRGSPSPRRGALAGFQKSWTATAFGLAVTKFVFGAGLVLACLVIPGFAAQAQGFDIQPWPVKKPIPVFEATDLNDKVWRSSDLRGRAVLINFWASWCEPCRAEMPSLQALAQRHDPEKLLVLAVNFKEPLASVQRFVDKSALSLPVLLDPQGALARQWGVSVFPSTVLLGADGRVHGVLRGELDWTAAQASRLTAPLLRSPLKQR